jgi:Spy/CpxP family protein refolding chaperone
MKKSAFLFCALIVSLTFLISSAAFALGTAQLQKRGMMGMHCISRWEMIKFIKNLDITDEQKEALKALKEETDNKTDALAAQMMELQDQMTDTFLATEIDAAKAESQIDAMLALQTQFADIKLHAELQAAQILTPDQRTMMLDMVNQIRECAESQRGWMGISKPSYFSLLMPEKTL